MGSAVPSAEVKALGKAFEFIHAVGIVPLAYMDANDRDTAKELTLVVDFPYTDALYGMDTSTKNSIWMNYYTNHLGGGGLT